MSTYNVLIFQQGGTLYLDEALPDQPTSCTISVNKLDDSSLSDIGGGFADISNAVATVSDLVLDLPSKSAPWKTISPNSTAGTIGDMVAEGRRFVLDRGGRKAWVRVSEFDFVGSDITELRLDEGVDYSLKDGDTMKDVRCSYAIDWSSVSSNFVGRVKATWTVVVNGETLIFVKVYDIVRQILFQPATWADVRDLRPDIDSEISQVLNKERVLRKAWQDVVEMLRKLDIRHNLIIPDSSTSLRDATVLKCLINLIQYHGLLTPPGYIGQTDDYYDELNSVLQSTLGNLVMPIDEDQDGKLSEDEQFSTKRQHWFRRPNFHRGRS